ncbi:hypothetical protein HKX48_002712 [Thoreauomyces humboldtii]|nr:hypothetical protein HKX48_002712 [Thoreauomyces humboldtii]
MSSNTTYSGGLTKVTHDMNVATAAEPSDALNDGEDEKDAQGLLAVPSADDAHHVGVRGSRPGSKPAKRERRKVSGFKRDSPLSYHEFVHGHNALLLTPSSPTTTFLSPNKDADQKKRTAECLVDERRGDVTELKVLINARITSPLDHNVMLEDTVPLHHAREDHDHESPKEDPDRMVLDPVQEDLATIVEEDEEPALDSMIIDEPHKPRPSASYPRANQLPRVASAAEFACSVKRAPATFPFPKQTLSDAQAAYSERRGNIMEEVEQVFSAVGALSEGLFVQVTSTCGLPRYFNRALFRRCGGSAGGHVTHDGFVDFYQKVVDCRDVDEVAFTVLGSGRNFLIEEDFKIVVEDVVQNHPGLEFLKEMDVFQHRYVETVVARIFYAKSRNSSSRMTRTEFRKDGVFPLIRNLQLVDDINSSRDVFSYKHFYVMYCKFWELDTDHDLRITEPELRGYENGCLSPLVVSRIFAGAGTATGPTDRMSYRDFVNFILAAENKAAPRAIDYWFRCLDVDGDGAWSLWELKKFFDEQCARMREFRMTDPWEWKDFSCAILDMVNPTTPHVITLSDLRRCGSASLVFDMIFDIRKYDLHLRRIDPNFREWDDMYVEDRQTKTRVLLEGWDKFAERAYEELAFDEDPRDDEDDRSTSSHSQEDDDQEDDEESDGSQEGTSHRASAFYKDEGDMWEDRRIPTASQSPSSSPSPTASVSASPPTEGDGAVDIEVDELVEKKNVHVHSTPSDPPSLKTIPCDIAMPQSMPEVHHMDISDA